MTHGTEELLKSIKDLAKERGIELPPIDPLPQQQPVYERFLSSNGFNPDQVDRLIEMERLPEQYQTDIYFVLMQAMINIQKMSNDELLPKLNGLL